MLRKKQLPMQRLGDDRWQATVPGKHIPARWDFMYYLEAQVEGGGGRLWPSWEEGPPYVVAKVTGPLEGRCVALRMAKTNASETTSRPAHVA